MKGVALDDVLMGLSVLRNQHLANVFYRLKLIEAYGTGMLQINTSYNDYAVKPRMEVSSNAFKITLPNTNFARGIGISNLVVNRPVPDTSAREKQVLRLFDKSEHIVRKDVEKAIGVSQSTAINLLRVMTEKSLLIKKGKGKTLTYLMNNYHQ